MTCSPTSDAEPRRLEQRLPEIVCSHTFIRYDTGGSVTEEDTMHRTATNTSIPAEVRDFCASRDLFPSLELALNQVGEAFPDALTVSVGMEDDPESDYRWVLIEFVVRGAVAEVHARFRDCSHKMAYALGLPAATLIRPGYRVAKVP